MIRSLRVCASASAVLSVLLVSGCSNYEGLNSFELPGTEGGGEGAMTVTLKMDNALNIVPNSAVRVDDLEVGTVRSIKLDGYQPVVTIKLNQGIDLPANSVAKIGQTSLLGAKHIELLAPTDQKPVGKLHDGSVLSPDLTSAYPQTEDVLASVATLLNGGGLAHIKTITTELNKALGGREDTARSVLEQSDLLAANLDAQKTDITRAIDSLDQFAGEFRKGNDAVAEALTNLPPALEVLETERKQLVRTMEGLGEFGVEASDLIDRGGSDLVENIANLRPALKGLADSGSSLTESLWLIGGVGFPLRHFEEYIRGDYFNMWATIDLGLDSLDKGLLTGTPLEGTLGGPAGLLGQLLGNGDLAGDPLTDPLASEEPLNDGPASPSITPSPDKSAVPSPSPSSGDPASGQPDGAGGLLDSLLGTSGGTQ